MDRNMMLKLSNLLLQLLRNHDQNPVFNYFLRNTHKLPVLTSEAGIGVGIQEVVLLNDLIAVQDLFCLPVEKPYVLAVLLDLPVEHTVIHHGAQRCSYEAGTGYTSATKSNCSVVYDDKSPVLNRGELKLTLIDLLRNTRCKVNAGGEADAVIGFSAFDGPPACRRIGADPRDWQWILRYFSPTQLGGKIELRQRKEQKRWENYACHFGE